MALNLTKGVAMPRNRIIRPAFWEDGDVGGLSREARLLLLACSNLADDEGILRWDPAFAKAQVFRFDDDLDVDAVADLMSRLEATGQVVAYRAGFPEQALAWLPTFRKVQRINRPSASRLPAPPLDDRRVLLGYQARDGACRECGESLDVDSQAVSVALDVPVADGGTDHPSNVFLAHQACGVGPADPEGPARPSRRLRGHLSPVQGSGDPQAAGAAARNPTQPVLLDLVAALPGTSPLSDPIFTATGA